VVGDGRFSSWRDFSQGFGGALAQEVGSPCAKRSDTVKSGRCPIEPYPAAKNQTSHVEYRRQKNAGNREVDHQHVQAGVAGVGEEGAQALDHPVSTSCRCSFTGLMKRP
jgi:hypothetical protein